MSRAPARVYSIPAVADFSRQLVDACMAGNLPVAGGARPGALDLAEWTILVPTRRAARTVIAAFAERAEGGASLLPRVRPLGDADDDDLTVEALMAGGQALEVPPAISPLQRQFALAGMILSWLETRRGGTLDSALEGSAGQVLALADSLGALTDRFETADVPLEAIRDLLDGELALHREDMRDFLKMFRQDYPAYLAANGLIGGMQRRSELIRKQAELWAARPPHAPVIAAGSTGSIPATAELLKTVAGLDMGAVVLPGLDTRLDEESWQKLEPHHPQFGFRELLAHFGISRSDVAELGGSDSAGRSWFMSEVMRPAATSDIWHQVVSQHGTDIATCVDGMTHIDAPDQETEALAIALIMRESLNTPGRTAGLITPDRQLARKVKTQLQRWALEIDDSAGEPAARSPGGAFLLLLCDAAMNRFKPGRLAGLLDHPFSLFGLERARLRDTAADLELAVMRGRLVPPGLEGLVRDVEIARTSAGKYSHRHVRAMDDDAWARVDELARRLQDMLSMMEDVFASTTPCPLDQFIECHVKTAEAVSTDGEGCSPLWAGEAGEMLAGMFRQLNEEAAHCPALLPADYAALVRNLLLKTAVRPRHARHPRLAIYGLLEARLLRADVTILAGLNEGTWPADAEIDPWLNRPEKTALDLDLPERRLGLMAHDFAQAASAPQVYLCSSRKIGGQPAVASRWLLRMKALLDAAGAPDGLKPRKPWVGWALGLNVGGDHQPLKPPRPAPPVSARPRQLSVTRIDQLIRDPYGIYARHVLGLEAIEPLDADLGARERGNLVHKALERFVRDTPGPMPDDAEARLMTIFDQLFAEMVSDPALEAFWRPQMQRMAEWFIEQDRQWRADAVERLVEQYARHELDVAGRPFLLSGVADRIDIRADGSVRLIDYKTGQLPAKKPSSQGYNVQLDLEAAMAAAGAFSAVGKTDVSEAAYVRLSGGEPAGEISDVSADLADKAADALEGLVQLLEQYADPAQPYVAIGGAARAQTGRPSDYDHLSRWREWQHRGTR